MLFLVSNSIFLTLLEYNNDWLHLIANVLFSLDRFVHVYIRKEGQFVFPL